MKVLVVLYLVLFVGLGTWSVVSDRSRLPTLELVAEASAVLVLGAGILFFLLGVVYPGGNLVWLWPVAMASAAEALVIYRDRKRTIRKERIKNQPVPPKMAALTDLFTLAFLTPAVWVNVAFALG